MTFTSEGYNKAQLLVQMYSDGEKETTIHQQLFLVEDDEEITFGLIAETLQQSTDTAQAQDGPKFIWELC